MPEPACLGASPAMPWVRLDVLFATDANRAVLLRRGPKWQFRLITWDLDDDAFTLGQWMTGRVRVEDLTPDGAHLLYTAEQRKRFERRAASAGAVPAYEPILSPPPKPKRKRRKVPRYLRTEFEPATRNDPYAVGSAWTAISRPPYFTALALWPRAGGGLFREGGDIALFAENRGLIPVKKAMWPSGRGIVSWFDLPQPKSFLDTAALRPTARAQTDTRVLQRALAPSGVRFVDWIVPGRDGRLLFAAEGCLFHVREWKAKDHAGWAEAAEMIADFRDMRFEPIAPPPEALVW